MIQVKVQVFTVLFSITLSTAEMGLTSDKAGGSNLYNWFVFCIILGKILGMVKHYCVLCYGGKEWVLNCTAPIESPGHLLEGCEKPVSFFIKRNNTPSAVARAAVSNTESSWHSSWCKAEITILVPSLFYPAFDYDLPLFRWQSHLKQNSSVYPQWKLLSSLTIISHMCEQLCPILSFRKGLQWPHTLLTT